MSNAQNFMTQIAVLFVVNIVMTVSDWSQIIKFYIALIWNNWNQ